MEFNSSCFHAFGNPDFAAVFSGDGGSAQAIRPAAPRPSADVVDGAPVKTEKGAARHTAPSSVFFVPDAEVGEVQSFLDECSLCHKCLTGDIFMYRGDTPFCSEECRRERIRVEKTRHQRKKQSSPKAKEQAAAAATTTVMVQRGHAPQLRQLQPQ